MEIIEKTEQKTLSDVLQTVQIALDTYDDIFSDFDPSPIERRILSDDFLSELRRRYAEREGGEFLVTLSIPKALRNLKMEALIKKRIKGYFQGRLKELEKKKKERLQNGLVRIIFGLVFSLLLFVSPEIGSFPLIASIPVLMWYFFWSGFEYVFEASSRIEKKRVFSGKLLVAEYNFVDQEEIIQSISTTGYG